MRSYISIFLFILFVCVDHSMTAQDFQHQPAKNNNARTLHTKTIFEMKDGGYIITSSLFSPENIFVQFISDTKRLLSTASIHTGHMTGDLEGKRTFNFIKMINYILYLTTAKRTLI